MNKIYRLSALWMMCLMLLGGVSFTACLSEDDVDTNQYKGGVNLNAFGPSPVARGGVLRFLGSGLDKVTGVEIPGCDVISDIEVVTTNEIRVTVPQTAMPGFVTLKMTNGTIVTKLSLPILNLSAWTDLRLLRLSPVLYLRLMVNISI